MGSAPSAPASRVAPSAVTTRRRGNQRPLSHRTPSREAVKVDILSVELSRAYASIAKAKAQARTAERSGGLTCTECVLCLEAEIDTVFLPCGHAATCRACAAKFLMHKEMSGEAITCPVCRASVVHINRIFVPRTGKGAREVCKHPILPDLSATWS